MAASVAVAEAVAAAVVNVRTESNAFTPPLFVGDQQTHTQTHKYVLNIIVLTLTITTVILSQKFYPKPFLAFFFVINCFQFLVSFILALNRCVIFIFTIPQLKIR
jgi:hypothetical protein